MAMLRTLLSYRVCGKVYLVTAKVSVNYSNVGRGYNRSCNRVYSRVPTFHKVLRASPHSKQCRMSIPYPRTLHYRRTFIDVDDTYFKLSVSCNPSTSRPAF